MTLDWSTLESYVGRHATTTDVVTAAPIARLAATLGIPTPASAVGDSLPPGWHGLYLTPIAPPTNLRPDGQVASALSIPAIPLKRFRVGLDSTEFRRVIRVGDELTRRSNIADIKVVDSAAGPVVHVTQRNEIFGPEGLAVVEEREAILSDQPIAKGSASPSLHRPHWRNVVEPTAILLFRFSALRFNSHRVHYDRQYAVYEEGLPGLMVQAALITQLLLEMCRAAAPRWTIAAFRVQNRHPIYDTGSFTLCGTPDIATRSATLWALDSDRSPALVGEASFLECG